MLRFIPSTPSSLGDRPKSPEFEFGSLTLESPYRSTSPADHLFLNGKLLPHEFPIQIHHTNFNNFNYNFSSTNISRTTSRASSVSSKDSLLSSRSNSTNSRSSSCSSARTSSSDSSERKLFHAKRGTTSSSSSSSSSTTTTTKLNHHHSRHNNNVSTRVLLSRQYQLHGSSSQRWQYITAVPSLSREGSRRRSSERLRHQKKKKKEAVVERSKCRVKGGLCRVIIRSFWETCMKCHALEPSKIKDDGVLRGNLKLQHKL